MIEGRVLALERLLLVVVGAIGEGVDVFGPQGVAVDPSAEVAVCRAPTVGVQRPDSHGIPVGGREERLAVALVAGRGDEDATLGREVLPEHTEGEHAQVTPGVGTGGHAHHVWMVGQRPLQCGDDVALEDRPAVRQERVHIDPALGGHQPDHPSGIRAVPGIRAEVIGVVVFRLAGHALQPRGPFRQLGVEPGVDDRDKDPGAAAVVVPRPDGVRLGGGGDQWLGRRARSAASASRRHVHHMVGEGHAGPDGCVDTGEHAQGGLGRLQDGEAVDAVRERGEPTDRLAHPGDIRITHEDPAATHHVDHVAPVGAVGGDLLHQATVITLPGDDHLDRAGLAQLLDDLGHLIGRALHPDLLVGPPGRIDLALRTAGRVATGHVHCVASLSLSGTL